MGDAYTLLREGEVTFKAPVAGTPSMRMPVFYNPRMAWNRTLSVLTVRLLLEEWLERRVRHLRLGFPLAASGIRVLRILEENAELWEKLLERNVHVEILVNDLNEQAIRLARENLSTPRIITLEEKGLKLFFTREDARFFLHAHGDYDYVTIDPYGTPNPFLDGAVQRLKHQGVLEVTLTDTAALTGSAPAAGLRKYYLRTPFQSRAKHLLGLHGLNAHLERITAMHERSMSILLSMHVEHAYKSILRVQQNPGRAARMLEAHAYALICPACHTLSDWVKPGDSSNSACPVCTAQRGVFGPFTPRLADPAWLERFIRVKDTLPRLMGRELERLHAYSQINPACHVETHQVSHVLGEHTISLHQLRECLREKGIPAVQAPFHPTTLALPCDKTVWEDLRECLGV